jgi:secreted trypsin-like serine protease
MSDAIVHGHIVTDRSSAQRSGSAENSVMMSSVVALVADQNQGQSLCTATLISPQVVLTAAHCLDGQPKRVMIVFAQNVHKASAQNVREVDCFEQHPSWSKPTSEGRGDIAIVHIREGAPEGYAPASLADSQTKPQAGTKVVLAGFGVTNGVRHLGAGVLRKTSTEVVSWLSPTEFVSDGQTSSVCFGDSGGPAFQESNRNLFITGVASAVSTQSCDDRIVHTAVAPYRRWIEHQVKRWK